ncbi:MAG: hypothetical protein ABEH43_08460 [Flavobacteriales bacterium]
MSLLSKIRSILFIFMLFLIITGSLAFMPEKVFATAYSLFENTDSAFTNWLKKCHYSLQMVNKKYPYLFYGYDWLAFAHIIIAIGFIGPIMQPVKNIWVVQFGITACIGIIPMSFIVGPIREVPFYWQLVDCLFGVLGVIPLIIVHKKIKELEKG